MRFSRSRPTVKLSGTGLSFASRSEGRRVMADMTGFDDIDIDFAGVDDVGQGFVDEVLRVWPAQHPGIRVHPITGTRRSPSWFDARSGADEVRARGTGSPACADAADAREPRADPPARGCARRP
ncbi:STAS-like domain-containing protein [Microbacterium tumbae]